MANYETRVGNTTILLEAKTSGAFAKTESGIQADPLGALENIIKNIKMIAGNVSREIGPAVMNSPVNFQMEFSIRADGNGLVMIGETPDAGQFKVHIGFTGRPPSRPKPRQ